MSVPAPNPDPRIPATEPADTDLQSRAESRIKVQRLACAQGKIADITGSGMRMIVGKGELPEVGDVQSYAFSDGSDTIEIKGTVKWIKNGSRFARRSEVGVEFVKLQPAVRDAILRLAVQGQLGMSHTGDQPTSVTVGVPNLYTMLGVVHCASPDEIKAAFRKECRRWHPDVNNTPEAAQRFDELNKAYSVLRDPDMRARYDQRFGEGFSKAG